MIQGVVAGDGEQPVDQWPAAIETVETLVGLEEGLLREILGVLAVSGELMQKTENAMAVAADDILEGSWVIGERGLDERGLVGGGLRGWRSELGRISLRKHRQGRAVWSSARMRETPGPAVVGKKQPDVLSPWN
jgi:hypothetical protein